MVDLEMVHFSLKWWWYHHMQPKSERCFALRQRLCEALLLWSKLNTLCRLQTENVLVLVQFWVRHWMTGLYQMIINHWQNMKLNSANTLFSSSLSNNHWYKTMRLCLVSVGVDPWSFGVYFLYHDAVKYDPKDTFEGQDYPLSRYV